MWVFRTRYPRDHKTYEAPESLLGLETEGPNKVIQDEVRSSEVSIWMVAGGVEEQMYSPQCLDNPFEKG